MPMDLIVELVSFVAKVEKTFVGAKYKTIACSSKITSWLNSDLHAIMLYNLYPSHQHFHCSQFEVMDIQWIDFKSSFHCVSSCSCATKYFEMMEAWLITQHSYVVCPLSMHRGSILKLACCNDYLSFKRFWQLV